MTDNPDNVPRTADEIQSLLSRPFRPEVIRSRKIAGKQVQYLPTGAVRERLTRACNTWHFRIVDRRFEQLMLSRWNEQTRKSEYREVAVYTVVGELEIPELGTRQAIGLQEMDDGSGADLLMGAASDALKKAAKLFDVTLDRDVPREMPREMPTSRPAPPPRQMEPEMIDPDTGEITERSGPAPRGPEEADPMTEEQRAAIAEVRRKLRVGDREFTQALQAVGVADPGRIDRHQAAQVIARLQAGRGRSGGS